MNDFASEKPGPNRKRFWILALVNLASIGSFALALYGVLYATMGALGGAISFGLMPFAGNQISEQVGETGRQGDLMITGGVIGGLFFLVLFFVLRRKLK